MSKTKCLGLAAFTLLCFTVHAATISGTVNGPDGAPFRGAFVRAHNTAANMTVSALSDRTGRFNVPNLPSGRYTVEVKAPGFRAKPALGLNLTTNRNRTLNFSFVRDMVRWSDLSFYQGIQLFPEVQGKKEFVGRCFGCHGFQTRMAQAHRNEKGWREIVDRMREIASFSMELTDTQAADISSFLAKVFGERSVLPQSPADAPGYDKIVRSFPDEAMKIVYVEYDMPGPNRMPLDANPAKDGSVWIPYFSPFNGIGRLDTKTGKVEEYRAPERKPAYIHSARMAPDGDVWFTELATNRIGKWDSKTKKIAEYQDSFFPGKENRREGGSKQTLRIDSRGIVWSNGTPLTSFDPKTEKFTKYLVANPYGIDIDRDDNIWFDEYIPEGKLFRVDGKSHEIRSYQPPTAGSPRRLQVAPDGVVWFNEYRAGKLARFDPKTETFKEYSVPGAQPTPYGIGIDKEGDVWYSSEYMDVIGRFDPKTERFTEYPFPHSENTIRELLPDSQGRVWWASSPNNKVGYFYLAE